MGANLRLEEVTQFALMLERGGYGVPRDGATVVVVAG